MRKPHPIRLHRLSGESEHALSHACEALNNLVPTGAIGRFTGLLRVYPEVSFADEALFLLGEAYRRNDEPQQAANSFDTLVTRYPDSRYANQARARLASLR